MSDIRYARFPRSLQEKTHDNPLEKVSVNCRRVAEFLILRLNWGHFKGLGKWGLRFRRRQIAAQIGISHTALGKHLKTLIKLGIFLVPLGGVNRSKTYQTAIILADKYIEEMGGLTDSGRSYIEGNKKIINKTPTPLREPLPETKPAEPAAGFKNEKPRLSKAAFQTKILLKKAVSTLLTGKKFDPEAPESRLLSAAYPDPRVWQRHAKEVLHNPDTRDPVALLTYRAERQLERRRFLAFRKPRL